MFLLWPDGIRHNDILFLFDVVLYTKEACNTIKVLYRKIIHVMCLAYRLYTIAEQVCVNYPKVYKLMSSVKQGFLKVPSQTLLFKMVNPGIPLPLESILTSWGIEAEKKKNWSYYYSKYFNEIHENLIPMICINIKITDTCQP